MMARAKKHPLAMLSFTLLLVLAACVGGAAPKADGDGIAHIRGA